MSERAGNEPLQEAVVRDLAGIGGPVALIGGERLRESARQALRTAFPSGIITGSSIADFLGKRPGPAPGLILLCAGSAGQMTVVETLSGIVRDIPVIVLAESDDQGLARKAFALGAKACIALSGGSETAIAAVRFILARTKDIAESPH
jgi:DNA-binding NarL/FixJ family response regulator